MHKNHAAGGRLLPIGNPCVAAERNERVGKEDVHPAPVGDEPREAEEGRGHLPPFEQRDLHGLDLTRRVEARRQEEVLAVGQPGREGMRFRVVDPGQRQLASLLERNQLLELRLMISEPRIRDRHPHRDRPAVGLRELDDRRKEPACEL